MSFFGLFGPPNIEKFKEKNNVQGLIKALNHRDEDIRLAAIAALGEIDDQEAVLALIPYLDVGADTNMREAAETALIQLGNNAIEPVIRAFTRDEEKRISGAKVLGQMDCIVLAPLIDAVSDRLRYMSYRDLLITPTVFVLEQIGKSGDEEAINPLIAAAKHSDLEQQVVQAATDALGMLGEPGWDGLIALLGDQNPEEARIAAIRTLGQVRDLRAVKPLLGPLQEKRPYWAPSGVPAAAAKALGQIGDQRAVEPLLSTLDTREKRLQENAVTALGDLRDQRAIEPLVLLYSESDDIVKTLVSVALGKIGDRSALERLLAALEYETIQLSTSENLRKPRRPDDKIRESLITVIQVLGEFGDKGAVEPLLTRLQHADNQIRVAIVAALDKLDPDWTVHKSSPQSMAYGKLARLLESEDVDERHSLLEELAKFGDYTISAIRQRGAQEQIFEIFEKFGLSEWDVAKVKLFVKLFPEVVLHPDIVECAYAVEKTFGSIMLKKRHFHVDNVEDYAFQTLSSIQAGDTSNLLHILSQAENEYSQKAAEELANRGNPPFDAKHFLKSTAPVSDPAQVDRALDTLHNRIYQGLVKKAKRPQRHWEKFQVYKVLAEAFPTEAVLQMIIDDFVSHQRLPKSEYEDFEQVLIQVGKALPYQNVVHHIEPIKNVWEGSHSKVSSALKSRYLRKVYSRHLQIARKT